LPIMPRGPPARGSGGRIHPRPFFTRGRIREGGKGSFRFIRMNRGSCDGDCRGGGGGKGAGVDLLPQGTEKRRTTQGGGRSPGNAGPRKKRA